MATITTDTYLDDGTARTAGETWTLNGGILTIRTDTRWHAGSPASMLGSIGATTSSATLGGGVFIDGTNVRWLAYDGGTGNVPAVGTTITGDNSGANGYLLGVWSSLTSAPTAVGAAMPATGFIKLREADAAYEDNETLTGIGATTDGVDKVGWIEVVQDQAVANTVPRLGSFKSEGDWFELGTTTGVSGQTIQVPTNGGGIGTHVPGLWIETASGSSTYEYYPSVLSGTMITTNFSTDEASKIVVSQGNGVVTIGSNGSTVTAGYVPSAGCKVRVPNIFLRQCPTGTRATNATPHATLATRPDFTTTSAGVIDFENILSDWYHLYVSAYSVRHVNCGMYDIVSVSNIAAPIEIDNCGISSYNGTSIPLTVISCALGGTVSNSYFYRTGAASAGYGGSIATSDGVDITNCTFGIGTFARNASGYALYLNQSLNSVISGCTQINGTTYINTSFNITIEDIDHIDRYVGATNTTTGLYVVQVANSSDNIIVDGVTFGKQGTLSNKHPYAGIFNSTNSSNLKFRNAGTQTSPLNGGSSNQVGAVFIDGGVNTNVNIQRCYLTATRTNVFTTLNTTKKILFESIHGTTGSIATASLNTLVKGARATSNSTTGQASVYGTHFFDMFESDTAGRIWWGFNEPTAFSEEYVTLELTGSTGGFTSAGNVSMPNAGDKITFETPYYILGNTGLTNSTPTVTGTNTTNFKYEYDIDNYGTGYTGTYKILNGTNLASETISPSIGFKLKLQITTTGTSTTNALTYVRINTASSLAAQTDNLYPLDTVDINLVGYSAGTRVYVYDTTNDTEIYNAVPSSSALTISAVYDSDFDVNVRYMYCVDNVASIFGEFNDTVTSNGLSRTIVQEEDTVYFNNNITGSSITDITIDDSNLLVNIDSGLLSWGYIYAYETYWLSTEEGIRDEVRFIEAIDEANYLFENFQIKNVTSPTQPLVIINGWGRDAITNETIDIIDTSGGMIFSNPDLVIAYATSGGGGGGATAAEVWSYSTRTLSTGGVTAIQSGLAMQSGLTIVNGGVQKASKLIPYNENL